MSRIMLEVCVDSVEDAAVAVEAGADRLEICDDLSRDGFTPSRALVQQVCDRLGRDSGRRVELVAMIRPRGVGATGALSPRTFLVPPSAWTKCLADVDRLADCGLDGLAFGAVTPLGEVDCPLCAAMVGRARERWNGGGGAGGRATMVFHRAMDFVLRPLEAASQIAELGFERVLTSGGPRGGAAANLASLGVLARLGGVSVMPGGGVRAGNAVAILGAVMCGSVHSSCRAHPGTAAGATRLDNDEVRALRAVLDGVERGRQAMALKASMT